MSTQTATILCTASDFFFRRFFDSKIIEHNNGQSAAECTKKPHRGQTHTYTYAVVFVCVCVCVKINRSYMLRWYVFSPYMYICMCMYFKYAMFGRSNKRKRKDSL